MTKPFGFYYSVYSLLSSALRGCKFGSSTPHVFIQDPDKHGEGARPKLYGKLSPCCHGPQGLSPEGTDHSPLQVFIAKDAMHSAMEAIHSGVLPHPVSRTRKPPESGPELTASCILDAQTYFSMKHGQNHDVKFTDGYSRFLSAPLLSETQACSWPSRVI